MNLEALKPNNGKKVRVCGLNEAAERSSLKKLACSSDWFGLPPEVKESSPNERCSAGGAGCCSRSLSRFWRRGGSSPLQCQIEE